jgi:hypothetical protein
LTYRLLYRAGFSVTAPVTQFDGTPEPVTMTVRIAPKRPGGQPLLLRDSGTVPAAPAEKSPKTSKLEMRVDGSFYLGEGEYHAEMVLADAERRVCRKEWEIKLKSHKHVATALGSGQLAALSELRWPRPGTRHGRLTILLHAGAPRWNAPLLESLAGIVEHTGFGQVRVVAFSLEQHKILLRQELASGRDFRRLAAALREFNPATVPYDVLQDPTGHRDLLWQLLAKEEVETEPADAVLFIGAPSLDDRHVFVPPACADGSRKTVYAYFAFPRPYRRSRPVTPFVRLQPDLPDAISRVTRACSGKVYYIHSPADLFSALEKVNALMRTQAGPTGLSE